MKMVFLQFIAVVISGLVGAFAAFTVFGGGMIGIHKILGEAEVGNVADTGDDVVFSPSQPTIFEAPGGIANDEIRLTLPGPGDTTAVAPGEFTVYPGMILHGPLKKTWLVTVNDIIEAQP